MGKNRTDAKRDTACDMLYVAACVLKGKIPDIARVTNIDFEQLYQMSKFHSLTAIVYEGLQSALGKEASQVDQKIWAKFKNAKENAVRKNLLFDTERAKLFAFMEEKGIWYMPLKGIVLKDMYPRMGLRQMADNDILYDAAYKKDVCAWFQSQGYKAASEHESNHDVYQKQPIYNFEMHTLLYGKMQRKDWELYYQDVKRLLLKDSGNQFGYHFSDEDFYIYIMTHGLKHFDNNGTGFRFLLDLYVYLEKKQKSMNWEYIQVQLKALGASEFEENCRKLVENLFFETDDIRTDRIALENRKYFSRFLSAGTHGSYELLIEKRLGQIGQKEEMQKIMKYYMHCLFPNQEFMKKSYPRLARYRLLLPIAWVLRLVKMAVENRKLIWSLGKMLLQSKRKQQERMQWEGSDNHKE